MNGGLLMPPPSVDMDNDTDVLSQDHMMRDIRRRRANNKNFQTNNGFKQSSHDLDCKLSCTPQRAFTLSRSIGADTRNGHKG
jgi:hypothetical protein